MKALGVGLLVLLAVIVALALPPLIREGAVASVSFWLLAAFLLYLPVYFFVLFPRRVRKLYQQTKAASTPTLFRAGPSGLEVENDHGMSEIEWSDLHCWKEGRHTVLLYVNDSLYVVLPKRCLTDDQLTCVKQYLAHHVRRAA